MEKEVYHSRHFIFDEISLTWIFSCRPWFFPMFIDIQMNHVYFKRRKKVTIKQILDESIFQVLDNPYRFIICKAFRLNSIRFSIYSLPISIKKENSNRNLFLFMKISTNQD